MLYNKNMVVDKIHNNIKNQVFSVLVCEAFINALPFDEDTFDKKMVSQCKDTMATVIESLGGYTLLETSIAKQKNPDKKYLLNEIDRICTESAKSVSTRMSKAINTGVFEAQSSLHGDVKNGNDIVEAGKLNPEEIDIIKTEINKIDLDGISEIIQDKVVNTIKEEKESYKREEDLKNRIISKVDELSNQHVESNENTDENSTYEAYIEYLVGSRSAKTYESLFSTLQRMAMEGVINNNTEDIIIPEVNTAIILECLGVSKSDTTDIIKTLENYRNFATHVAKDEADNDDMLDKAFTNSILSYTALETLNTMNLLDLNVNDIRNIVENNSIRKDFKKQNDDIIDKSLESYINNISKFVKSSSVGVNLEETKNNLTVVQEMLSVINNNTFNRHNDQISAVLESIDSKLINMVESSKKRTIDPDDRYLSNDIFRVNEINTVMGRKPNVSEIIFESFGDNIINVNAINGDGNIVGNRKFGIELVYESYNLTLPEYIDKIISESNLHYSDKKITKRFK